ncbi:VanZ family protein [Cohnella lupini]|uniref:VanZ like protein n=1 Tax=Cohnella lupini TaxID=1294267 RepID=A0A3D9ICJ3_9BACL|nr:VanZ family protein [Cohnella lupini]RED59269.1 VanZ like protein [Cohnella lupini]
MEQKNGYKDFMVHLLFAVYIYGLFKVILFKFRAVDPSWLWQHLKLSLSSPLYIVQGLQDGNLTPFKEISRTLHVLTNHDLINLFGNIAIFIPFGIFIGVMFNNKSLSFTGAFACSFALSLCLESAQIVFAIGSFDVDDLILNSGGGLIGFAAVHFVKWMGRTPSIVQASDRPI